MFGLGKKKGPQEVNLNSDQFKFEVAPDQNILDAALKAGVQPIRIVRHDKSVSQYGKNYFGNTLDGKSKENPFTTKDLEIFYSKSVGIFGESIYPIVWKGAEK